MKRAAIATLIVFLIVAALLFSAFGYYFFVTRGVSLDPEKLSLSTECVTIYDKNGDRVETPQVGEDTPYEEFPDYLPRAFVAVEDKRFFEHHGFDYKRIGKAILKNITSFSFREGASTISQQLIKNTHLSSEKTVSRKLREFKLTRKLEKKYSKEEILALYLNSIYFGHSAFGIGEAAHYYFGKTPAELTPAESALLAALVKSPNRYSPFKDPEKCLARRNFVLSLMLGQQVIGESQYAEAVKEPLPEAPARTTQGSAYLSRVFSELAELFPDAKSGEFGNLCVYTALDPALQKTLEKTETESDCVLLIRDNKTNAIKALYATAGTPKRLPASTIKPLLVYAPAIEEGILTPATPLLDAKTDFGGYSPDDAGGATGGYMSAREALSKSANIPAVKLLNTLGVERGAKYLSKMGLDVEKEDLTLALALGGMKEGFSLPALADGYATLASGGTFAPSGTILRVTDRKGNSLYERRGEKRVFSEETSFLVNDMLKSAATEGTARKLKSLPFPVSAKTGTAESGKGNLDAYTVAYTPRDVVAVWLGNADNSPINATGGGLPANFAKRILEVLYRNDPPEGFSPPDGVTLASYDRAEYAERHRVVLADPMAPPIALLKDYFPVRSLPTEQCTRYSCPKIETPEISVKNGGVIIILCQAEYYDYVVKRENRGTVTTIYSGKYRQTICDNSVESGESYVYTVTPLYRDTEGEAVELPRVYIGKAPLPADWWEDQNSCVSAVFNARSTSASTSSFPSSSSM